MEKRIFGRIMFAVMSQYRKLEYVSETGEMAVEFGLVEWTKGRYIARHNKYQENLKKRNINFLVSPRGKITYYVIDGPKNMSLEEAVSFLESSLEERVARFEQARDFESDLYEAWG